MMNSRTLAALGAAAMISLVAACGGGGGSSNTPAPPTAQPPAPMPPPATPPPATATTVVGAITGFGSVFVNGVKYETDDTAVTVDDSPGAVSDLSIGHIVTIVGVINDDGRTGVATSIHYDDDLKGPVQAIDLAAGELTVLGQTVLVDTSTVFDDSLSPRSLEALAVGDVVEISGRSNADGVLVASRIEPAPATVPFEVKGIVSDLDVATSTFRIGSLVVDYSSAMLEDFPGGVISNGDFVEAKGPDFSADGALNATRVQREDNGQQGGDAGPVQVEGYITRFVSASDFDVAGMPVTTTETTLFENGNALDLALNVKVQVEGVLDDSGTLQASKVSIRRPANVRIEAPIQSIDPATGTLTMLGITVVPGPVTMFDDDSDADKRDLSFADLTVGDFLEVRGTQLPGAEATVTATRIERDDPDEDVFVRGPVDSVQRPELTILGVTIQTSGNTDFEDLDDTPLTADAFFGAVGPGSLVKAKGTAIADTVIAAREVEFED